MSDSGKKFTVVITGGGTGGHVFPAIAVVQELKQDSDVEKIYYVGCERNMEKSAAEAENIEFFSINVCGMPRTKDLKLVKWFIELFFATQKCKKYLKKIKPDIVFGTGGYVSGPVLLAAKSLKIPYVVHDCDAYPGIVNRFMAKWASAVSISFEQAEKYLNAKNTILNGNPIRQSFFSQDRDKFIKEMDLFLERKTILAMGGSQGAEKINNAVLNAAETLISNGYQIIHQIGKKNYDKYMENLRENHPNLADNQFYKPQAFFENMPAVLNSVDIAISRAGSLSISELNLCGLPSILVPYPYAAANHQRHNARAMEQAGASLYLEDLDCNAENIINFVTEILNSPEKYNEMKEANKSLAKPNSTKNIIKILKEIVNNS